VSPYKDVGSGIPSNSQPCPIDLPSLTPAVDDLPLQRPIWEMTTFDRRRIQAPESTYAPSFTPSAPPEAGPFKRIDRRKDEEARPICP